MSGGFKTLNAELAYYKGRVARLTAYIDYHEQFIEKIRPKYSLRLYSKNNGFQKYVDGMLIESSLYELRDKQKGLCIHTVKKGDTLTAIASHYYRDKNKWPHITKANRSIIDPDKIYPGQVLIIPYLLEGQA